MQPTPSSESARPNGDPPEFGPTGPRLSRATILLIRGLLYAMSHLGGAAIGTSLMALLLYRPIEWRWAWLCVGGLLAGACAVRLIAYFPAPESDGN